MSPPPASAATCVASDDLAPTTEPPSGRLGWLGSLDLHLERLGQRTVIARRRHQGPLQVQRAFHEPDGSCQIYLLHPPGGVVGGDALHLSCRLGPRARALLTTPAATKLYRSAGPISEQRQTFIVGAGAALEWLPQETIAYAGALAESHTRISLERDAQFCGWEVTCLGQDNRGLPSGRLVQGLRLSRDGSPLWTERAVFEAGSSLLTAAWGLAGRSVVGTFLATGAAARHVDAARDLAGPSADDWLSATLVGEVLVCRYLGYSAEAAKRLLGGAWRLVRPDVSDRQAHAPRIWST